MTNVLDYLHWRGDLTTAQAPFNEVDALILAKLAYIPFEMIELRRGSAPVAVGEAASALLESPDLAQRVHFEDDVDLLRELAASARFRDMRLSNYIDRIDEESQTQFAAITVQIADRLIYVSYRGTDATLVGWKENFNMTFTFPVPAQKSALDYLERLAAAEKGRFILGGHSKGGNLAMYAAATARPAVQRRIDTVYNFDGPGFDEKMLGTPGYERICGRMRTFVPQSSIVGLLLSHEEKYTIVKSAEKIGVMQHDISSWEVERDHLVYLDQVTNASKFIDRTLKGWAADVDVERREKFFDALYEIISKTNARTLHDLDDNWFESAAVILSTYGSLDEETKKVITHVLSLLIKNVRENLGPLLKAGRKTR